MVTIRKPHHPFCKVHNNEIAPKLIRNQCIFNEYPKLVMILFLAVLSYTLHGQKIYQVMYEEECDVRIMMVADASECDLKVFFVDDETKASKDGCWFVCDFPDKAETRIFFTEDPEKADIRIFITEEESEAGWVNGLVTEKLRPD